MLQKDIAAKFGLAHTAISDIGIKAGLRRAPGAKSKPERNAGIIALFELGVPYKEIAEKFGVTRSTINHIVRKAGLK
jgi:DNA invertase Pin-like site-specific DNA recombinase